MLIQFSVKNYKTFKDKATLSLVASGYDKDTRENENVISEEKFNLRILKSAVVYGANASGKSRLFDALSFMRHFALTSSKESQKGENIDVDPFRLCSKSEKDPSEFEVIFINNNVLYRYGFEAVSDKIVSEWLYYKPNTKEVELFYREGQKFKIHPKSFPKGSMVEKGKLIRDNALMLSVSAQFNEELSIKVINCFRNTRIISGILEIGYKAYSFSKIKEDEYKAKYLQLLKAADLGIDAIAPASIDRNSLPVGIPSNLKDALLNNIKENEEIVYDVKTLHKKYDAEKRNVDFVNFSLDHDESEGTKKFFYLLGPIVDVLEKGYTFIVDELDSKLHPNLVCKIIELFNSKVTNPNNAQLIFNTQNTNLLSSGLFRRDQIWFAEKNKYGEASLYSLADFKTGEVRKNEAYEDNYIRGKYGAVPYLGSFDSLSIGGKKNEK